MHQGHVLGSEVPRQRVVVVRGVTVLSSSSSSSFGDYFFIFADGVGGVTDPRWGKKKNKRGRGYIQSMVRMSDFFGGETRQTDGE